MKKLKLLSLLVAVATVVTMAVPAMAASSAPVSLTAVVGGGSQAPTICAVFQTPDDLADPGTQFAPIPVTGRTTKFYVVVGDPNNVNNINEIDIQVMYPTFTGAMSGKQKLDVQAMLVNGVWTPEDNAIAVRQIVYGTASDYVDLYADDVGMNPPTSHGGEDIHIVPALISMFNQGRLALGSMALGDDTTGVIHDVENFKQLVFEITANIDPCEPALTYTVNTVDSNAQGNTTTTPVVNTFTYTSVVALVTDFTSINWGQINVGKENIVYGDNNITTAAYPTVENLGNDRAMISLNATPMTGSGFGKQIKNFDAKMNQLANHDAYGNLAIQNGYIQFNSGVTATINQGTDPGDGLVATPQNTPVVLPPCATAQIDFSIFPAIGTLQGTYTGSMTISIAEYSNSVVNAPYVIMPTN